MLYDKRKMTFDQGRVDDSEQLLKKAVELGDSTKTLMSDVIGMPDNLDKQYIQRLILNFEEAHPGWIKSTRDTAREELADKKFGTTKMSRSSSIAATNTRYMLELPEELNDAIEKYIPTIFRDIKHFQWFCRTFPELLIPEKY